MSSLSRIVDENVFECRHYIQDNPMCNWIPGSLPQGESKTVECVTEDASGRYVSLSMTGKDAACPCL